MPVQQRGTAPVKRGGGLVPPEHPVTGTVEIRVHGVAGTPPAQLLSDLTPDQVAGDNIAGFYRTVDDGDGRHIEAYSWGGLTSRSSLRVLWILMLPFALSNLAGWMCQPSVARHRARFLMHRFSARAAALLLTLNVVILLQMIGEDLIAVRCHGVQTCTDRLPPVRLLNSHFFVGPGGAHLAGRAMAVGALLPVVAILVFELLSHASAKAYERVEPAVRPGNTSEPQVESAAGYGSGLDSPQFWNGYASARRLSLLHTSAAIAFVAATLAVTVQRTVAPERDGGWVIVLAAVGGAIVLLALILHAVDTAPAWTAWTLFGPSVLALAGAVWLAWSLPAPAVPPAYVADLRYVADGMWVAQAVVIIMAFLIGGLSRRNVDTFPRPATGLVSLLAIGIVNAFGSLIIILVGTWVAAPEPSSTLGTGRARDRALYAIDGKIATWIIGVVLAAIVVLVIVAGVGWLRSGNDEQRAAIKAEYGDARRPVDPWTVPVWDDKSAATKWLRSIARFRFIAKGLRQLGLILRVLIPAAIITVVVIEIRYWTRAGITPPHWMTVGAGWLALLLPVVLMFLLRLGWRSMGARRGIGIVWDVATFWPRAYHPYAPPCYAERAVPELGRRVDHLQANSADVTIAAHSQGSVITAAALLQRTNGEPADRPPRIKDPAEDTRRPVGLLTFGSPLDTLYRWAFPAYFDRASLLWISARAVNTVSGARQWTNCYYQTDYVGRTWIDGAHNGCLTDPPTAEHVYREPLPAIGTHSGYWQDHRVWHAEFTPDPAVRLPRGFTTLFAVPWNGHQPPLADLRRLVDRVEVGAADARLSKLHIAFRAGPEGGGMLTVMTEQALSELALERFRRLVEGHDTLPGDEAKVLVADGDSALPGTGDGEEG